MNLFDHLDRALLEVEHRDPKVSHSPSVWPSEASAELFDKTEAPIIGKCGRAVHWRMIGEPQTNPTDAIGLRRFRMGRACEEDITQLAKDAGIFVASGVRTYVPDIFLPIEEDLVVVDPQTGRGYTTECKSIYGYFGNKQVIKEGHPKIEGVMQLVMYLNEIPTGAKLKQVVAASLEEKAKADATGKPHRNRIEVNQENLAKIDDGPLYGKLVYESRDECATREFNIGVYEDPLDGMHYPTVDGEPYKLFTVESIYTRYKKAQDRWRNAIAEGERRLAARGIVKPEDPAKINLYWEVLGKEVRGLPLEFLPPADYQWRYSPAKVEKLHDIGLISESKYKKYKGGPRSKGTGHCGAWQCAYCSWKNKCVAVEYPEMRHIALDFLTMDEEAA